MKLKCEIVLDRDELNSMGYPVVVEMWDKVMGSMSRRRKYQETFTESERVTIAKYHRIFYNWHLIKGTPESAAFSGDVYELLQKACNFFGGMS